MKPTRLVLFSFSIPFSLLFVFLLSTGSLRPSLAPPAAETRGGAGIKLGSCSGSEKDEAFGSCDGDFSPGNARDGISEETQLGEEADEPSEAPSVLAVNAVIPVAGAADSPEDAADLVLGGADFVGEGPVSGVDGDGETSFAANEAEGDVGLEPEAAAAKVSSSSSALVGFVAGISGGEGSPSSSFEEEEEEEVSSEIVERISEDDDVVDNAAIKEDGDFKKGLEVIDSLDSSASIDRNFAITENRCDLSHGSWVYDRNYPLYSNKSCPFIDEGFSCEANGRPNRDYLKWRWQPRGCSIPRFDPVKMLEAIRGKRLVFVGDSLNRNQWESMLCLLREAVSDPGRVYEARRRRITKGRGNYNFKFADYRCSVEYYVSHYLVQEGRGRVGKRRYKSLKIDKIDKNSNRWIGADILVFNTAHWWSHHKTKAGVNYFQEGDTVHAHLDTHIAYRKALSTWAAWVDRHVDPKKTRVFFRSSSPSHFSGGGWDSGGHCKESTWPFNATLFDRHYQEKNTIIEDVARRMKTPVTILNITSSSGMRIDGHPSVYGRSPARGGRRNVEDCSHWCLPGVPDAWNELLHYHLLPRKEEGSTYS